MKLNPFIVMRRNRDGSGTFFDPDTGERADVNRTGRRIWEYLEAGGDESGIAAFLARCSVGAVSPNLEAEVRAFLQSLADQGYLERED